MRVRLSATVLAAMMVAPAVILLSTVPSHEAQAGTIILEPVVQSQNNPWKIRGLGTGVQVTFPQMDPNDQTRYPFLSGLVDLEVNLTYRLRNAPATMKFQAPQGSTVCCLLQFTTDLTAPSSTNTVRCGAANAGCPLGPGGWRCAATAAPSRSTCQNANATTDTTQTVFVARDDTTRNVFAASRFNALRDGTPITFRILATVKDQASAAAAFEVVDGNGGDNYHFRVDTALPNGTLTTFAESFDAKTDRVRVATNSRTPLLVFNFTDPFTGAGIDPARVKIFHNATWTTIAKDNTTQYERTGEGSHHAVFAYSYAAGKGHPFKANAVTHVTAQIFDDTGNVRQARDPTKAEVRRAGQIGNTPAFSFRGWNVTVDTLAPTIGNDFVTTPGNRTTVAPGAQFEVRANVTDNLVGLQRMHAVLFNASRGLWSDEFVLEPVTGQAKTFRNTTVAVPTTWPDTQVSVQVNATDKVGNRATKLVATLALDTKAPAIVVVPVPAYVRTGPYLVRATVVDNGTGIDPATVTLLHKVGAAAEQVRTMVNLGGGEYSAQIPDQADGSVVSYRIRARDRSGGEATTVSRGFVVDKAGPTIGLSPETDFVGQGPYQLGAIIADAGAGVDEDPAPSLKWRAGTTGTYTVETMTKGAANLWTAGVPDQPEGGTLQYFIEATDVLGNRATKGTSATPLTLTVDKTPPTFNLTVPRTVTKPEFEISWDGDDAVSGVATYTVEFRESSRLDWIGLPDLTNTTATSYDFCAVGGRTYHLRGWATDRAGNSGAVPQQPMATVEVDSDESCVAPPNVALQYPNGDEDLTGDVVVLWTAASPQFGPELDITLQVSEDKTQWTDIEGARGLPNTGNYAWPTQLSVSDGDYWLRVRATDPNGLVGVDESDAAFTVTNGIAVIGDTDNDGLPDAWEREHFGTLAHGPKADPDGDSYFNDEEFAKGTNPASAASHPGGVGQQWSEAYWLVLALFAAVLVVTVLGFATRW